MTAIWFTSDNHFGHDRVIRYSDRPFAATAESVQQLRRPSDLLRAGVPESEIITVTPAMDAHMVSEWNRVVQPGDTVYHVGDFALWPHREFRERLARLKAQLRGRIVLVKGNHDHRARWFLEAGFERVERHLTLELEGLKVLLRHKPPPGDTSQLPRHVRPYPPLPEGGPWDLILCGHVHEAWRVRGRVVNVGVDQWGYRPTSLPEILAAMEGA